MVSFNAEDMGYRKPQKHGKATWYALFDGLNGVVGDYLIGPLGTFFIAAMQPLLPILADATADALTVCTLTSDHMRADEMAFRAKTLKVANDSLNLALSCYGRLVL